MSQFYTLPPFTSKSPDEPGLWLVSLPVDPSVHQQIHVVRVNDKLDVYAMGRWIPKADKDYNDPGTGERIARHWLSTLFLISGVDDPAGWNHLEVTYLPVQLQDPQPIPVEEPPAPDLSI